MNWLPSHFRSLIDLGNRKFHQELPGLFDAIEDILQHGGSGNHKIDDVLEQLTVGDIPVKS